MTQLSVNVNKIATLRNARGGGEPDLVRCVETVLEQGVQSITAHPRADRRHITPEDIRALYGLQQQRGGAFELNWEGDIRHEFLSLVREYGPTQCTLVPVSFGELTSHRGYRVAAEADVIGPVVQRFRDLGIRVSVFVEGGDEESVSAARDVGCDRIEMYTAPYAQAQTQRARAEALRTLYATADKAVQVGLGVNAGHDLTHHNLGPLLKAVPMIHEVSVGHHLMCYALEVGLAAAVQEYLQVVSSPR